ncbi:MULTISPECIES: hypothetical protein [unclassified Actinobaculum]|uniref:hypothetical protein n=1 Tax=unclassified Actinobaculum TaxID=2609299 RepID=UPI000D527346|nr:MULTISPECIES: hypothetical protein [unclassified Actinobaculum]AWE41478.1 hypothetical protein DDD63_00395 [Actinobaculum sp. 313]RTE48187.1 hypothetical protein EKN07_10645 [Actinobaculum sp. 352]
MRSRPVAATCAVVLILALMFGGLFIRDNNSASEATPSPTATSLLPPIADDLDFWAPEGYTVSTPDVGTIGALDAQTQSHAVIAFAVDGNTDEVEELARSLISFGPTAATSITVEGDAELAGKSGKVFTARSADGSQSLMARGMAFDINGHVVIVVVANYATGAADPQEVSEDDFAASTSGMSWK